MKQLIALSMLALMLILSACAPATTMPEYVPTSADAPEQTQATAAPTQPPAESEQSGAAPIGSICTSFNSQVSDTDWVRGKADAPVTILEYSDFQCPYCAKIAPILTQLLAKYPEDVRIVFRHFPLPGHSLSVISAQAAEAAGNQGMFFEFSDAIFADQATWSNLDEAGAQAYYVQQAQLLGLDAEQFQADMISDETVQKVNAAQNLAYTENVSYTPFLLSNGMQYQASDLESLSIMVETLKAAPIPTSGCPATVIDSTRQYTATIQTRLGDVTVDLLPDQAPVSVNAFAYLAQNNWYKNSTVFNLIPDQTTGNLKYVLLGNELNLGWFNLAPEISSVKFDQAGMVGLLNNTQLFIALDSSPDLDGSYTIIGKVSGGLDLFKSMQTLGEPITNIIITEK